MSQELRCNPGERGQFFRPAAVLAPPVYLEETVRICLTERAARKGVSLVTLVNDLLRREIETPRPMI